jgi:hypothetical protein
MARSVATLRRLVALALIAAITFGAVAYLEPGTAHAAPGCAKCEDDPVPEPPSVPVPRGEENAFVGQAALFNTDGQVVDSGGTSCPGCEWQLEKVCALGGSAICAEPLACGANPDGTTRWVFDVWLHRPGTARELRGSLCLGNDDDALTADDIWTEVETQWRALVPDQAPTIQPPDGQAITNLPTYFHSGQPHHMPARTIPVFNFTITITARGQWEWTFEPGTTKQFDIPGSRYNDPNPTVNHTYHTTGPRTVTLTTRWWGSFTIGTRGPYTIQNPATQGPYTIPLDVTQLQPRLSS